MGKYHHASRLALEQRFHSPLTSRFEAVQVGQRVATNYSATRSYTTNVVHHVIACLPKSSTTKPMYTMYLLHNRYKGYLDLKIDALYTERHATFKVAIICAHSGRAGVK